METNRVWRLSEYMGSQRCAKFHPISAGGKNIEQKHAVLVIALTYMPVLH